LTQVVGFGSYRDRSICQQTVTHPSSNRARCRATACVDRDQQRVNHGPDPGFGFGGGQVESRRRKDIEAPRVYGVGYGEGVRSPEECLFLQRNTSRSIPALRLPTLCHSRLTVARSKALECLQKRVLNIIFPGSEYDKFNHCQRRNTESRRRLLL